MRVDLARSWAAGRVAGLARTGRRLAVHPDALALIVIVLVGAAVRAAFYVGAPVFVDGDSFQYYRPAHKLMSGDGFPLPLKRAPAYPVFLALVGRGLGEELRQVAAVQALLGLATAALSYGLGRLALGRGAGLVAGLAVALSGGLLIFEHYLMTEALFTFLLTLALLLFLVGLRWGAAGWFVACGIVVGLGALTRPHAQLLPLVGAFVAAFYYRAWWPAARVTLLVGGATAVVLLPWMIRNQVEHGVFTVAGGVGQHLVRQLVSAHAGKYVFSDPANPPAGDRQLVYTANLVQRFANEKLRDPDAEIWGVTVHNRLMRNLDVEEAEADELLRRVTLEAIRARPLVYAGAVLEDLSRTFVGEPEDFRTAWKRAKPGDEPARLTELLRAPTSEQERHFERTSWLVNLYQSPRLGLLLPILFVVGLAAATRPGWRLLLLPGLTVVALHLASAATVGYVPRYHHPTEPLTHVVAFGGALALWQLGSILVARLRGQLASSVDELARAPSRPR